MLQCLRQLDQYELLEHSHQREYRFVNDQNLVEKPYIELIKVKWLSIVKNLIQLELGA